MIEQLKSAADQLRAAWDNYLSVYSTLQQYQAQKSALHTYGSPPELSRLLDTELTFVSSFPPKIEQIEIAIRHARNYSPGLAPINALPPEILTRIFHLVIEGPCRFHRPDSNGGGNTIVCPRFPDYLAQVYSLWRQTAISSPLLWRHIDLSYDDRWSKGVDRAAEHTDRAGLLPIELHVAEETCYYEDYCEERRDYDHLRFLLVINSHLVETLEIVATGQFGPFHRTVFDGLFNPGGSNLKKLVLCSQGEHHNTFIFPTSLSWHQLDHDLSDFALNITESQFSRGFSTITVLHVRGIFPSWSSTAYHGLVDLRLLSTSQYSTIKEAEIILILKSSPGLHILHFGLKIGNPTPEAERVTPVHLDDLEVVKVVLSNKHLERLHAGDILRLLAPGQKPLRLSLEDDYTYKMEDTLATELDRFLARSRLARIQIQARIPPLSLLVRHSAHLESVILTNLDPQLDREFRASLLQVDRLVVPACLDSLRLRRSQLSQGDLRVLLASCPSGIVLDGSFIYHDESQGSTRLSKEELTSAFPEVKTMLASVEDPTADWDILD